MWSCVSSPVLKVGQAREISGYGDDEELCQARPAQLRNKTDTGPPMSSPEPMTTLTGPRVTAQKKYKWMNVSRPAAAGG